MSDNKVILNYDGNSYEYPIVESTIGDRGIDISKLRDQTGLITLDLFSTEVILLSKLLRNLIFLK